MSESAVATEEAASDESASSPALDIASQLKSQALEELGGLDASEITESAASEPEETAEEESVPETASGEPDFYITDEGKLKLGDVLWDRAELEAVSGQLDKLSTVAGEMGDEAERWNRWKDVVDYLESRLTGDKEFYDRFMAFLADKEAPEKQRPSADEGYWDSGTEEAERYVTASELKQILGEYHNQLMSQMNLVSELPAFRSQVDVWAKDLADRYGVELDEAGLEKIVETATALGAFKGGWRDREDNPLENAFFATKGSDILGARQIVESQQAVNSQAPAKGHGGRGVAARQQTRAQDPLRELAAMLKEELS